MKHTILSPARVILDNPFSPHSYFAWPSAAVLQDGRIAVSASGFRLAHVCPFGKAVMALSEDGGESYGAPMPVIDTCLDDRDAGLCPFGENGLILTSFNNTVEFQRENALRSFSSPTREYVLSYLSLVSPEEEKKVLGATFRVSFDGGVTFGPIHRSPVTSPHGPLVLSDGTVLWVGRLFSKNDAARKEECVCAYVLDPESGECSFRGAIENLTADGERALSCEPHTVQLPSGRLVCHIRVQNIAGRRFFSVFQSVSDDLGAHWSKPVQILPDLGGSPAHLLLLPSGALLSTYGYREFPFGIRYAVSLDGGESWDVGHILYENEFTPDLGYPETVLLPDGDLLTVFYAHPEKTGGAKIMQIKWRLEL